MTRRMLIDAIHPEETRVVVMQDDRLEEFDYETAAKKQLKGNIYLAKVTRVEPSLQAAFVEYGGNRHGFLAFSEIHPDYYQIPVGDREALIAEHHDDEDAENGTNVEDLGGDEPVEEAAKRRPRLNRQYKIQEVIKRRQIMLVQVVKEERGNKGAALTTYLSLAGRYCVLMPNTARGGGVSRKITNAQDRKRLKELLSDLAIPTGMGVILRTAGQERSKAEIKRDYDYLLKLWEDIRTHTLESTAPCLIHEEGDLVKRSLRDLYDKDIDEVLVAGEEGYRTAKDFMKALIPSHAKKVQPYRAEDGVPLFHQFRVERQITKIFDPVVQLRSGGSIVIHQTEALVAIDVNSGKATRERNIEETAVKTNLEAADEVARQLRLRDLAGLIVVDFIDMEDSRHDQQVERRMKDALRRDRARIQTGRISGFGLLEMSRQRLRPSLQEAMTQICPACHGTGHVASTELAALTVLRAVEDEAMRRRSPLLYIEVPTDVALYLLNHKRQLLADLEERYGCKVLVTVNADLVNGDFSLQRGGEEGARETVQPFQAQAGEDDRNARGRRGRGRNRRGGRDRDDEEEADQRAPRPERAAAPQRIEDEPEEDEDEEDEDAEIEVAAEAPAGATPAASPAQDDGDGLDRDGNRRRRRRGRRGGRRRRRGPGEGGAENGEALEAGAENDGEDEGDSEEGVEATESVSAERPAAVQGEGEAPARRGRNRRGRRGGRGREGEVVVAEAAETMEVADALSIETAEPVAEPVTEAVAAEPVPAEDGSTEAAPTQEVLVEKPKRRGRRPAKAKSEEAVAETPAAIAAESETMAVPEAQAETRDEGEAEVAEKPAKPKRAPRKPAAAKAEPKAKPEPKAKAPRTRKAKPAEDAAAADPAEAQADEPAVAEAVLAQSIAGDAEPVPAPVLSEPASEAAASEEAAPEGEDDNRPKKRGWWNLGR